MKRTDTWKPLGSLTTQIAAKLMERREAELNAGPIPALGTGCELAERGRSGLRKMKRNPDGAPATGISEKPAAPGPKTESGGSDPLKGERAATEGAARSNRPVAAIALSGDGVRVDPAESTRGTGRGGACMPPPGASVIDWREHPRMILAWGHVRTPSPKSRRAKSGARSPR